jgi:hypothetical protein
MIQYETMQEVVCGVLPVSKNIVFRQPPSRERVFNTLEDSECDVEASYSTPWKTANATLRPRI